MDSNQPQTKPKRSRAQETLAESYPALEAEWDYVRNGDLLPTQVSPGSSKKVWWTCFACGHSWQAIINNRAKRGSGCPACSGRVPRSGQNDVASRYPQLMLDWDYENNPGLDPTRLMRSNNVRVAWRCHTCGTQWRTSLVTRTLHDAGCPACRDRERVEMGNLLILRYPDVAAEWDYSRNLGIDVQTVAQYSDLIVWWRCRDCDHEYQARVRNRTNGHTGCPRCAQEKIARRAVASFAEQGFPIRIGVTCDKGTNQVFSGLGRCGCIDVFELQGEWDAAFFGLRGEDLPRGVGQVPTLRLVEEIDTTGMKRESIVHTLDSRRITHFITGELGGNAMLSLASTGTLCFYDVTGDVMTCAQELLTGSLRGKRLKRARIQRL